MSATMMINSSATSTLPHLEDINHYHDDDDEVDSEYDSFPSNKDGNHNLSTTGKKAIFWNIPLKSSTSSTEDDPQQLQKHRESNESSSRRTISTATINSVWSNGDEESQLLEDGDDPNHRHDNDDDDDDINNRLMANKSVKKRVRFRRDDDDDDENGDVDNHSIHTVVHVMDDHSLYDRMNMFYTYDEYQHMKASSFDIADDLGKKMMMDHQKVTNEPIDRKEQVEALRKYFDQHYLQRSMMMIQQDSLHHTTNRNHDDEMKTPTLNDKQNANNNNENSENNDDDGTVTSTSSRGLPRRWWPSTPSIFSPRQEIRRTLSLPLRWDKATTTTKRNRNQNDNIIDDNNNNDNYDCWKEWSSSNGRGLEQLIVPTLVEHRDEIKKDVVSAYRSHIQQQRPRQKEDTNDDLNDETSSCPPLGDHEEICIKVAKVYQDHNVRAKQIAHMLAVGDEMIAKEYYNEGNKGKKKNRQKNTMINALFSGRKK